MTPEDLERMFEASTEDHDALGGTEIRESAKQFARVVLANAPAGAPRTKAICMIVEAAMQARRARRSEPMKGAA